MAEIKPTHVVRCLKRIVLLDGKMESEGAIETAIELSPEARVFLAASTECALVVKVTAETGTATITVDKLEESSDGTQFRLVEDLSDTTVAAIGEYRIVMSKRVMAKYVKVIIKGVTLDANHNLTLTIALECTIDPSLYSA